MHPTKRCSVCAEALPTSSFHRRRHYVHSGVRAACQACTSRKAQARRRALAARQIEARGAFELRKNLVRARTRAAVRRGILHPTPCLVCQAENVEAHHPDYLADDAHLNVEWLCRLHHAEKHGTKPWVKQLDLFRLQSGPTVSRETVEPPAADDHDEPTHVGSANEPPSSPERRLGRSQRRRP
jgi:hypothetical protein